MKTESAFWDASAMVPLCCRQASTRVVRQFARRHRRIVVWWGISVEIQSAFYRLLRESQITDKELAQALKQIEMLRRSWMEVLPSEQLRGVAENLPERYGLRALDAFQFAAALIWCKEKPRNRFFVCFDESLAGAADRAGFTVFSQLAR